MNVGRLHCITDVFLQCRFGHAELAALMADGGADVIQIRHKEALGDSEWRRLVERVLRAVDGRAAVLVNDAIGAAAACGAAGVHVGRDDADVATVRRTLGRAACVGRTANDLDEATVQAAQRPDYLGVGPVFGTRSKRDPAPRLGLDGLEAIVAAVGIPVIAIGSIEARTVPDVVARGAHGVAVLSAVTCAADPAAATAALREAIDAATPPTEART